jgi:hypothetical protein
VAKSGAIGGVMAPVGAAAFGLAPVAVGALGLVGGGQGVKSGIENVQQGHNWSAGLNFLEAGAAFMPMASKNGRNAMFGAEARARTAQTAGQVWSGTKNLSGQAWNGVKNFGAQGFGGVKNLSAQAWNGTKNLSTQAWNSTKNLGAQAWSGAKDLGSQAWNGAQNFKGMITGADGLSFIDPILANGSKGGMMRNIAAWRMNNFRKNSTTFYSVQGPEDAARLSAGGTPWPIEPNRAHMGPGLYSWGSKERAVNYFNIMNKRVDNLEIMPFRISNKNLNSLNKLDLRPPVSDDAANAWLGKYSSLYGEGIPHDYEYVIRGTGIGAEHYFSNNAFHLFR